MRNHTLRMQSIWCILELGRFPEQNLRFWPFVNPYAQVVKPAEANPVIRAFFHPEQEFHLHRCRRPWCHHLCGRKSGGPKTDFFLNFRWFSFWLHGICEMSKWGVVSWNDVTSRNLFFLVGKLSHFSWSLDFWDIAIWVLDDLMTRISFNLSETKLQLAFSI